MKIGFIGSGKMALALAQGIVRQNVATPSDLLITSPNDGSQDVFLSKFPPNTVHWTSDNAEVARAADLILIAVKPQVINDVLPQLRAASANKLVVSIAAGISLTKLESALDKRARVVRCMPNTPVLVGAGACAYALGRNATPQDDALVMKLLSAGGFASRVEEKQINAVTATSGSGPAYVFYFIEAMITAGIKQGLSKELARELAIQTTIGSALMVRETKLEPSALADAVKSPKGTTIAACEILETEQWREILVKAIAAAKKRADELGAA
ncbi:MAG: pyrroline-5-carboxylate reductase [Verrucomicrobia bacterium Tous-C9LFEB]|nr:MAG: pyrroline-5-carboxylate reductase [Verrucomicrobia bacterium Tous-C9LFEB]